MDNLRAPIVTASLIGCAVFCVTSAATNVFQLTTHVPRVLHEELAVSLWQGIPAEIPPNVGYSIRAGRAFQLLTFLALIPALCFAIFDLLGKVPSNRFPLKRVVAGACTATAALALIGWAIVMSLAFQCETAIAEEQGAFLKQVIAAGGSITAQVQIGCYMFLLGWICACFAGVAATLIPTSRPSAIGDSSWIPERRADSQLFRPLNPPNNGRPLNPSVNNYNSLL